MVNMLEIQLTPLYDTFLNVRYPFLGAGTLYSKGDLIRDYNIHSMLKSFGNLKLMQKILMFLWNYWNWLFSVIALTCDKRGNYNEIQRFEFGNPGKEFCVDSDGFQITPSYSIEGGHNGKKCDIRYCPARNEECGENCKESGICDCECTSSCY